MEERDTGSSRVGFVVVQVFLFWKSGKTDIPWAEKGHRVS